MPKLVFPNSNCMFDVPAEGSWERSERRHFPDIHPQFSQIRTVCSTFRLKGLGKDQKDDIFQIFTTAVL
ncbi:hypothetical protein QE152_g12846 [Popillia japonica]|uniref:Uncharacterized protein n=1 Tax=Popillia japonica TaxID=7064 RepID=A0AAW1LGQ6_POPJA